MAKKTQSYSRVAKVPSFETTIRQTSRSGINLVNVTHNLIDILGVDVLATKYNTARSNDGLNPVFTDTVGRYGRGEARKLPFHFSTFIVGCALKYSS